MNTTFKYQDWSEFRLFDLISTGAVEEYQQSVKQFDNIIKEAPSESKRNIKKAKNILLHHYKQMFITNALHIWSWWLKKAKTSNHEEFDGLFILEKLVLIRTEILQELTEISTKIGFEIDERDKQYMTDKMDFLQEQYKHLNLSDENSSKA
jgi:hypothetical protein